MWRCGVVCVIEAFSASVVDWMTHALRIGESETRRCLGADVKTVRVRLVACGEV